MTQPNPSDKSSTHIGNVEGTPSPIRQTSVSPNLFQPISRPTISDNLLDDPQIAAILQPPLKD